MSTEPRGPMKKSSKKTAIALLLILTGVAFLILKGISDTGVYYRTVAEVLADSSLPEERGVRISGEVAGGSIRYDQKQLTLTFRVRDLVEADKSMAVLYRGIKPDAFTKDVEVILEGSYDDSANMFYAETLLAKCPSKYEGQTEEEEE